MALSLSSLRGVGRDLRRLIRGLRLLAVFLANVFAEIFLRVEMGAALSAVVGVVVRHDTSSGWGRRARSLGQDVTAWEPEAAARRVPGSALVRLTSRS
jgi:hypothetical protein